MTKEEAFLLISEVMANIDDAEKDGILDDLDISDEAFTEAKEIVFNSY
jgi:hypothetical protein|tara:strand:+ start:1672 stop:1815 length:144 start_codon:yes stop_codon:yes gene_type:complete